MGRCTATAGFPLLPLAVWTRRCCPSAGRRRGASATSSLLPFRTTSRCGCLCVCPNQAQLGFDVLRENTVFWNRTFGGVCYQRASPLPRPPCVCSWRGARDSAATSVSRRLGVAGVQLRTTRQVLLCPLRAQSSASPHGLEAMCLSDGPSSRSSTDS